MIRREKYPDTDTFTYYNANPKNKITDDCVIRALCTAMEKGYEEVYTDLFNLSLQTGYMLNCKELYHKYLDKCGWIKHKQPRNADNTKLTGKEFCELLRYNYNIIANIGGHHVVAIIDGKINDIWDSTDGCIGNYWTKG